MKKLMAILLAVALSTATLTACTAGGTSSTVEVSSIEEVSSQPVYNATITLRSTFTPNDWMTALFNIAAEDSGVKYVNVADTGDETYRKAVTDEFEKGNDPDVLYYWMGDYAEPFIADNKFVSIEEIKKDYPDFASDHNMQRIKAAATASDDKQYFIPGPGYSEALFANKSVLAAAGVSVPDKNTTYEQWVEDLKTIKNAGYIALSTVFDPAEGIHYLWEYTSYNNEKSPQTHEEYDKKNSDKAAAYAKGLDDIKALYQNGLLHPKASSAKNGDAFDELINDKAAFHVGGSWSYNVGNPNITITYFPAKAGSGRKSTDAIGGISMGFAISRKAYNDPEKRDCVVQFVNTVTSAEALLSYGEWRSYTLSADAIANKTRAYFISDSDWLVAARVANVKDGNYGYYYQNPLSESVKSALDFNAGITMFSDAVQNNLAPGQRSVLFGRASGFFNGNGTSAGLIASMNATRY
jgi:raffinose/stachyose/melibiose transport system substrate-binding protein